MIAYPLGVRRIDDEFEKMVEELREQKRSEELKKEEERKKSLDNQRKLQELQEKKKGGKNGEDAPDNPSYDVYGRVVEVHTLAAFPQLEHKCSQVLRKNVGDADKGKKKGRFTPRGNKKKEDRGWETEFFKGSGIESNDPRNGVCVASKVYDTLVPAAGVTICETGKTPKVSATSMSQKVGKLSKLDMITQMTSGTIRASTSIPNLLPNINRTEQGILHKIPNL